MGLPSKAITNQLSTQHDGPIAEAIQVLEPGPNPPTVVEIATRMVAKITTNADLMLDALIRLAIGGHYQAAEYLLSQMHRLAAELKNTDSDKWSARLGPLVASLQAEYCKRSAITIDADPEPPRSPAKDISDHGQPNTALDAGSKSATTVPASHHD